MVLDTMSRSQELTRTRILKSTLALLESGAAEGVRMADIAKRAGISRQALYLHFPTRAELLDATTLYLDEITGVQETLEKSRNATTGGERLDAFIEAWGNHMPVIHGVARALLAMKETDPAAAETWNARMQDVRDGCEAAVKALKADGDLRAGLSVRRGTDLLWALLSVDTWERLTVDCGWNQKEFLREIKRLARLALVASAVESAD